MGKRVQIQVRVTQQTAALIKRNADAHVGPQGFASRNDFYAATLATAGGGAPSRSWRPNTRARRLSASNRCSRRCDTTRPSCAWRRTS